ncbi:MAG: signal peptidase II [Acidobacteriaceae bacterium]|nr:signal peptidase II [Acidobacteriaceae bacterium]MBV9612317.1 signal peptidase II [Acidobacteriaceae bacterium]
MPQQRKNSWPLLPFTLALLVVVADRISKLYIQHSMSMFDSISVMPGWLRIVHTENPGAAFGVLAQGNATVRSVVLIGISALVLIFVASALWKPSHSFTAPATRLALALILGGAIGNLYDRILRGTVTDFVEVYHGAWSFPAFNVADSAITTGACLLVLELLWSHRKRLEEHARVIEK